MDDEALKSVNIIIKYLSNYGLDHHSRHIGHLMPKLLELELPSFVDYLESRNQQTDQIFEYTRKTLNEDAKTVGIMPADFWLKK